MRWSYGVKILSLYFYSYSQDSNSNPELEPFSQEIFVTPFLTLTLRSLADAMARIFSSTWKSITVQLSLLVQFNIYHLNLCRKKPWADRSYETRAVCVASQNAIPWRSSRKQAKIQTHSLQIFRENITMAAGAIQSELQLANRELYQYQYHCMQSINNYRRTEGMCRSSPKTPSRTCPPLSKRKKKSFRVAAFTEEAFLFRLGCAKGKDVTDLRTKAINNWHFTL